MVTRGSRGRGFNATQKKSSSGGWIALLFLLLLSSVGFSVYLYQENTRTDGITTTLKVQNADLSSQTKSLIDTMSALDNQIEDNKYLIETLEYQFGLLDKEKTVLEKENSNLRKENENLENQLQILRTTVNEKPPIATGQIQDPKGINELTLAVNSLTQERDVLTTKAAALETIINNKNDENLDLQIQLAQSNDQIVVLSNEIDVLKITLSVPTISSNPPQPQPPITCDITKAKLVKRPPPIYPRRALERGIEGTVKVQMDVSASGKPINITVVSSSSGLLTNSAIRAAEKVEFKPAEDCNGNFVIEEGVISSYKYTFTQ